MALAMMDGCEEEGWSSRCSDDWWWIRVLPSLDATLLRNLDAVFATENMGKKG